MRKKFLWPDRPNTADSLISLASIHRRQGDVQIARPFYERALDIQEKFFGLHHRETKATLLELEAMLQGKEPIPDQ
ncbi:tetratricopeptide repeat protein [Mesorhizobium sp. AR02]|uniref:tetratricopeptide repeat protein n=1 Tax=Mesorhizobium sp. AR02 TaxID=2865837 RepID=UPI003A5C0170